MEELKTEQLNNEELFDYVDQCMINLQYEDQMVNKPLEVLLILIKEAKIKVEELFISLQRHCRNTFWFPWQQRRKEQTMR